MSAKKKAAAKEPETEQPETKSEEEAPSATAGYPLSEDSPLFEPATTVDLNPAFVEDVE